MKANLFSIFAGLLISALMGCSMDNQSSASREEWDRYQKLMNTYKNIEGTYFGSIFLSDGTEVPGQIRLVADAVPNGRDADGNTRMSPILRARYSQFDRLSPDLILEVTYYEETGNFSMTSNKNGGASTGTGGSKPSGGAEDYDVTLEGNISNDRLQAKVRIFDNLVTDGTMSLVRISRSVDNSAGKDSRQDYNKRIRGKYCEVAGYYDMRITPPPAMGTPFDATLNLEASENSTTNMPELVGSFTYGVVTPTFVKAVYKINLQPREVILNFNGANGVNSVFGRFACKDEPASAKVICGTVSFKSYKSDFKARLRADPTKPAPPSVYCSEY